ncbi:MAG: GAF domain-containing protein, partial [Desulfobulbaceae bacterium]|nr:GAF domain-containing protein [Desulfobulbaceae bacterium]
MVLGLQRIKIFWKIFYSVLMGSLVSIFVFGLLVFFIGKRNLNQQGFVKLNVIRNAKAIHIEGEIKKIKDQADFLSHDLTIINAMREFAEAFSALNKKSENNKELLDEAKDNLEKFYERKFLPKLNQHSEKNYYYEDVKPDYPASILLQNSYIANNPNPIGSKQLLAVAPDGTLYSRVHEKYHNIISKYQKRYGFYDIFLIDIKTQRIVYSVFKEMDFGKSLRSPLLRETNFAHSYRECALPFDKGKTHLADYEPYYASYNMPAFFISVPIYDNEQLIGVLSFQISIDTINAIMTHVHRWEEIGLGKTGEVYLVGSDYTMRNESRSFVTDKEKFLYLLANNHVVSKELKVKIDEYDSVVGMLPVRSPSVQRGLKGESDNIIFTNYRGVKVMSSFSPMKIDDIQWVILAEIEVPEALLPLKRVFTGISILMLFIISLMIWFSRYIGNSLAGPLMKLADEIKYVEQSGDLSCQDGEVGQDEVGQTVLKFHSLLRRWEEKLLEVGNTTKRIVSSEKDIEITVTSPLSNKDILGRVLSEMEMTLVQYHRNNRATRLRDEGISQLNNTMRGEQDPLNLASNILHFLVTHLKGQLGVFYIMDENGDMQQAASFAFPVRKHLMTIYGAGEGMVGQAVLEKEIILLKSVPPEYTPVQSGLGEHPPNNIIIAPFIFNDYVEGVAELGTLGEFTPTQVEFLKLVSENVAISMASARSRIHNVRLLEQTQLQ